MDHLGDGSYGFGPFQPPRLPLEVRRADLCRSGCETSYAGPLALGAYAHSLYALLWRFAIKTRPGHKRGGRCDLGA